MRAIPQDVWSKIWELHENLPETTRSLSIIEKPQHRPFAITGPSSYFIGFDDFRPDTLGEHLKGDMMGIWFPPYRFISSLSFWRDKQLETAVEFETHPRKRVFHFIGFDVIISVDGLCSSMRIEVAPKGDFKGSVEAKFKVGVLPIWDTFPSYEYGVKLEADSPKISINGGESDLRIKTDSDHYAQIDEENIVMEMDKPTVLTLTHEKGSQPDKVDRERGRYRYNESGYSVLHCREEGLKSKFQWSKVNMEWLYSEYDSSLRCITAGQPEFPWFFSIDTFISLEGLLSSGYFEIAKNSLSTLFNIQERQKGRMPHEILANGKVSNPGNLEETAYAPFALMQYYKWTLDAELPGRYLNTASMGLEKLLSEGLKGKGVMEDHNAGEGIDIDTVCYFIKGCHSLVYFDDKFGGMLKDETRDKLIGESVVWGRFIEDEMWIPEENAYADRYIDGVPRLKGFWTTIIPFEQQLAPIEHYNRFAGSQYFMNMLSDEGLKTDQNGAIMPVNTGLLVKSMVNYNDLEKAWSLFLKNISTFGKFSSGCFPEISNNSRGCFLQAWSGAVNVENLIEGFMGIYPQDGQLRMNPRLPEALKNSSLSIKRVRLSHSLVDFDIS